MFNKLGLRAKIITGGTAPLVFLIILGIMAIAAMELLHKTNGLVDHTHVVIEDAGKLLTAAVDMETGMRGYLLAGKEEFLKPYKDGRGNFEKLIADLKEISKDDQDQVEILQEAEKTVEGWINDVTEPMIALRRDINKAKSMEDMADIVAEERGRIYFEKFRRQIGAFIENEQSLMAKRQAEAREALDNNEVYGRLVAETARKVEHSNKVIDTAQEVVAATIDMENGMRGFLLAGLDGFLRPYNDGKTMFFWLTESLADEKADNPAQVQLLKEIDENIGEWLKKVVEPNIRLRKEVGRDGLKTMEGVTEREAGGYGFKTMDDVAKAVAGNKGRRYLAKFKQQIGNFNNREKKLMDEYRKKAAEAAESAAQNRQLIVKTTALVEQSREVVGVAREVVTAAVDMETGMRGYLLAGKEEFLNPYKEGRKKFTALIDSLEKNVVDNPDQLKLLGQAEETINQWHEKVTEPMIALRRDIGKAKSMEDMADLVAEARGARYFNKFREQIAVFINNEESVMKKRQADAAQTVDQSNFIIYGSMALAVCIALVFSWLISISITRPFKEIFRGLKSFSAKELEGVRSQFHKVIEGLDISSRQVNMAGRQMSDGASEQAAGIEQTSAAMEQMNSMTKQNADNAQQADSYMKETNKIVSNAEKSMQDLTSAMREMSRTNDETSKIIKVIDEIAFQTNLLALNAAVEAARAGEAGQGFAVVADEVRNLAQRAAEAAKNTAALIEGAVDKVNEGTSLVTRTNEAFGKVAESSRIIGQLVGEIAAASGEQSQGIDQVNTTIGEMDKVVQRNAAGNEELASQAKELTDMVGILISIVEGEENQRGASAPAGILPAPQKSKPATRFVTTEKVVPMDDDFEEF